MGFIGKWATVALAAAGFEVHVCSHRKEGNDTNIVASPAVICHTVDLLAHQAVSSLMLEVAPTDVLHLAWETTPGSCFSSVNNLSWVQCTLGLARSAVAVGCTRFVGVGSCAEYDWTQGGVFDEQKSQLMPSTLYGATKAATFQILNSYAACMGIGFAWARLFHQYGPHEHPGRLVPSVMRAVLAGKEARCSDGEPMRDYLCCIDTGEALAAVLTSRITGPVNIGSGRLIRLREIAEHAAELAGDSTLLRFHARSNTHPEPLVVAPRLDRLRREVGWIPRIGLREGLTLTLESCALADTPLGG
jgi:nucleoside-diphosphate-sugar epimerase